MTCRCTSTVDLRSRAAMCHTCIYAEHAPNAFVGGAISCTIEGGKLLEKCPKGKFGESAGVVKWLGLEWYGVPYPIRLALWICHPKHPKPSGFTGCGCLKVVKDWWKNLKARPFP